MAKAVKFDTSFDFGANTRQEAPQVYAAVEIVVKRRAT